MRWLNRREALKRAMLIPAVGGVSMSFAPATGMAAWTEAPARPVTAEGYGTDPDLIHPSVPWPNTLTDGERQTLTVLADLILPQDGDHPPASAVGVVDVLDEWVSAPYPDQQAHRHVLLSGLVWLDDESIRRQGTRFAEAGPQTRSAIVDVIAFPERADAATAEPVLFFSVLRSLVVAAYYTSPEGVKELGYVGNVPIAGDYPGPSEAAMTHLGEQLVRLGLQE